MKIINQDQGAIYCGNGAWVALEQLLVAAKPSKVFVLTDENTHIHCLPYFNSNFTHTIDHVFKIPQGEIHKNIATCLDIWNGLSNFGADRHSILINLGGGVVTDLGGFAASTYQRGISFINIPTSLLAMVDASVGGKNGVDLGTLKNQIGIIKNPKAVIVDAAFLNSLPNNHILSGMAEMIKHGFISSENYLNESFRFNLKNTQQVEALIWESIVFKNSVITKDPNEKGLRKILNFGHTLGHAIESYFLRQSEINSLLHGEAIAIGMVLELYISHELLHFPLKKLALYTSKILGVFPKQSFTKEAVEEIIKLLSFDKKNRGGKVLFVLLEDLGQFQWNLEVSNNLIEAAFKFYENFVAE